jgi:hypothetical protein
MVGEYRLGFSVTEKHVMGPSFFTGNEVSLAWKISPEISSMRWIAE